MMTCSPHLLYCIIHGCIFVPLKFYNIFLSNKLVKYHEISKEYICLQNTFSIGNLRFANVFVLNGHCP